MVRKPVLIACDDPLHPLNDKALRLSCGRETDDKKQTWVLARGREPIFTGTIKECEAVANVFEAVLQESIRAQSETIQPITATILRKQMELFFWSCVCTCGVTVWMLICSGIFY